MHIIFFLINLNSFNLVFFGIINLYSVYVITLMFNDFLFMTHEIHFFFFKFFGGVFSKRLKTGRNLDI